MYMTSEHTKREIDIPLLAYTYLTLLHSGRNDFIQPLVEDTVVAIKPLPLQYKLTDEQASALLTAALGNLDSDFDVNTRMFIKVFDNGEIDGKVEELLMSSPLYEMLVNLLGVDPANMHMGEGSRNYMRATYGFFVSCFWSKCKDFMPGKVEYVSDEELPENEEDIDF